MAQLALFDKGEAQNQIDRGLVWLREAYRRLEIPAAELTL